MKVKSLELNNYRGFKGRKSISDFSDSYNVFVGINGSGKTSILDIIAMFLNHMVIKLTSISSRSLVYDLRNQDISLNEHTTENIIELNIPANLQNIFGFPSEIKIKLKKDKSGSKGSLTGLKNLTGLLREHHNDIYSNALPIFKYYQAQRDMEENTSSKKETEGLPSSVFSGYNDSFTKSRNFDQFIKWFIDEDNKENRMKVKSRNFEIVNPQLSGVRNALEKFFGNFPSSKYTNLRVEEEKTGERINNRGSLFIDKDGVPFDLNQLSLGEKTVIMMIADIAYRLTIVNLYAPPLKGTGIILIDEVDLHLHPAWQREIVPGLVKTFPNIQFFITTHSPQVLSRLDSRNIYVIDNFEILRDQYPVFGKDSNTILQDYFDVPERPEDANTDFRVLNKLLDEEKLSEAEIMINDLEKKYGADDKEIKRAKLFLNYYK